MGIEKNSGKKNQASKTLRKERKKNPERMQINSFFLVFDYKKEMNRRNKRNSMSRISLTNPKIVKTNYTVIFFLIKFCSLNHKLEG